MNKELDLKIRPSNYYSDARPEMLKFIPKKTKKILDVGCGEGAFGASLKQKLGAEVWGLEINSKAAREASKKLDKVLIGDIEKELEKLPNNYFDCVVFNDVLEHLVDPYEVLRNIKKKISSDGSVVCSLPNIRYFYTLKALVLGKEWHYVDAGILDKTHLRFFTMQSAQETFKSLGYKIEKIEGINPFKSWKFDSWKFDLLNILTFGSFSDSRYYQIALVARPK
jgi:2-polyprenyl-3-methyl-5-hydroxy-6-metoxy-1,4-benzoquinol methylase